MKIFKTTFTRIILMAIVILLEFLMLFLLLQYFYKQAIWIESILKIASVFIVLGIANYSKHLSFDLFWMILIVASPVFGTTIYLLTGADLIANKTYRNLQKETEKSLKYYVQDQDVYQEAMRVDENYQGQLEYIVKSAQFPVYKKEHVTYYPLGDLGFPIMLEELKKAEKFIFMEYFIIEEGILWGQIQDILEEKVKQGIEVRVMYDDIGSVMTVPSTFAKKMQEKGIQCISFNRLNPIVSSIMNHRDHRKILVIDGKVAFTGGINLADNYINQKELYGHWKDNVIRFTGEAVWSFTVLFLTNWNAIQKEDEDYEIYHVLTKEKVTEGYIIPYGDTPLDNENVAQNIYMNMLHQAKKYCYIMTPYLIIDPDMKNALILARKRGVDVRIITPGIPDKEIIWKITKSYFPELIREGIQIYAYTPGFVHAKVFVCDDVISTVGTVNLDYRSLYLHFENGLFLYYVNEIDSIKQDLLETMKKSKEIKEEDCSYGVIKNFFLSIIRLFSPML